MPTKTTKPKTKVSSNTFRTKTKFNRRTALIFAAITTLVGAVTLYRTFADTPAPTGTYTDWNWPGQNYTSFDWNVTPGVDQTGPDAYFFSHQFGYVNGNGGYAGMQGDENGKRAIFSLWQSLAARGPGTAQPFGGEGTGYQTVISYPWVAGRSYKFHLQKDSVDTDGTWWGASITDTVTGAASTIGEIKVPLAWGGLSNFSIAWIERYGGQMSTCSDIHHAKATFSSFRANGYVPPSSHNNHLASPVNCPGSQFTDVSGGVIQEMGVGNDLPPIITASPGTSLSDLTPTYATVGYGSLQKDLSVDGHTITLNGQKYARGLGAHASSDVRYNLAGQYSRFKASVGIDDEVGNSGSVSFQVWADGAQLFDSGLMTGPTPTKNIDVDVTGKQELKLIVTNGGDDINYDHGDWADARLIAPAPTPPPPPAGDTAAPVVAISSPANGAKVTTATYIVGSATDNVGVTKIELYVDGVLKSSAVSSSISYTWISYYASAGNHTITIKAYDKAGNVGQKSITVVH